jgi:hypothetical protein
MQSAAIGADPEVPRGILEQPADPVYICWLMHEPIDATGLEPKEPAAVAADPQPIVAIAQDREHGDVRDTQDSTSLNSFGIGVDGRRNWSAVGINGGRAFTNDIQLDGLPVMGGGYNEAAVVPNTEGLQEGRVISNNFSAEYGRGQAVISMATRSGTNAFHGSAAYLLRNENLDANTFSNNAQGIQKREFRVNDGGGAIGGPIRRNSVFFFSSYHGLRNNQGSTTLATVPTALERVGNFSQSFIRDESGNPVPARVFNPFDVVQEGADLYRRVEVPNAIIANPHPAALRMFSFYPLPNRTPDDVFNTNNFEASTVQTVRRHSNNNRVDWRAGKHSIYVSGGISYATIATPGPSGSRRSTAPPGSGATTIHTSRSGTPSCCRARSSWTFDMDCRTSTPRRSQATRKGSPNSMPLVSPRTFNR